MFKRAIFLTPGLVELSTDRESIHYQIGQELARAKIDLILLIANQNTNFITQGVLEQAKKENLIYQKLYWPEQRSEILNQPTKQIIIFTDVQTAHNSLEQILKPLDVILFQNDWTDNYL